MLTAPTALAFDSDDNLYISDLLCGSILRVAQGAPTVSIFASGLQPAGFDFDSEGRLVVVDRSVIRRFDPDSGQSERIAGDGRDDFQGDDGPAFDASFEFPRGLVIDAADNIFVSDTENFRIRRIDDETGIVTTIAGQEGTIGDGGRAPNALLEAPIDVQFDSSGNLYVSDHADFRVRRVDVDLQIRTLAPTQDLEVAQLTLDPQGAQIVSGGRWNIHRIDLDTLERTIIVGGGEPNGFTPDGELAAGAAFSSIFGVIYDRAGNLYFSESGSDQHNRVRRVDAVTLRLATVAGTGVEGFDGDGGPATAALLHTPIELAFDSAENLYLVDQGNRRVRRVDAVTGLISTIAGGGAEQLRDGLLATEVSLEALGGGMAIDQDDRIYITNRSLIVRVDTATGQLSLIGSGDLGEGGDGGPARDADFTFPVGMTFDDSRNLFIVDGQRVRAIRAPIP